MKIVNVLRLCAALGLGLLAPTAQAQGHPTKPVRVITPFAPGSGPDSALRVVGQKLSGLWGQQVVVENRPGGNGFIAIEAAKKAPADGYTLVQMDDTHMSLLPHLHRRIPYDVARDFDPVAALFRTHFFVVVPTGSPWRDVGDLVAAAKARPGDINYGSWFVGSPGHLGAAMLEGATGTRMTHIPYKAQSDLFAGVGNGDVAKVNEDVAKVLADPEVRERFAGLGYETFTAAPADMAPEREADLARYGEIVRTTNISIE